MEKRQPDPNTTVGIIKWELPEYTHKEKSNDWYWALAVVVVCGSIASVIYGNYFFAALLIIGGVLMGFFAGKKPDWVEYELNERGFKMKNRIHPYENIKHFWVDEKGAEPMLLVYSDRPFMPVITAPIQPELGVVIREKFLQNEVEEKEIDEGPTSKIMDAIGY